MRQNERCEVWAKLEELGWNECVFISFQACKMCFNEGSSINGIRFVLIFWLDQWSWSLMLMWTNFMPSCSTSHFGFGYRFVRWLGLRRLVSALLCHRTLWKGPG